VALFSALALPSLGQDPTPRWPDGHPNLGSAPGAKGYFETRPGGGGGLGYPRAAAVPLQPWARALMEHRDARVEFYPPGVRCKPTGGPGFFGAAGFEIVDVPELQKIFILNITGAHSWRVVHMDGRPHPQKLRPTYFGHSTGRWEGDTLVIDTVGFNEKSWIRGSLPNTKQLHTTERITRPNRQSIRYEVTIEDPGAYTGTYSGGFEINPTTNSAWIPDGEPFEYICQDTGS
jgi:hypothetical protein